MALIIAFHIGFNVGLLNPGLRIMGLNLCFPIMSLVKGFGTGFILGSSAESS